MLILGILAVLLVIGIAIYASVSLDNERKKNKRMVTHLEYRIQKLQDEDQEFKGKLRNIVAIENEMTRFQAMTNFVNSWDGK